MKLFNYTVLLSVIIYMATVIDGTLLACAVAMGLSSDAILVLFICLIVFGIATVVCTTLLVLYMDHFKERGMK